MLAWLSVWSEVQTCPADKIGFTFVLPAHPGSPDKQPLNGYVCVLPLKIKMATGNGH